MIPIATLREAERHLARNDPQLARLIEAYGPCTLGRRRRDPFHVLCSSIVGQQLSTKAADTIMSRVADSTHAGKTFMPIDFVGADPASLRAAGLSTAKSKWLIHLAKEVDSGALNFRHLRKLTDEQAISRLSALPGIGRWTAEMFLIFALDRLDIYSLKDIGLRRALERVYAQGTPLSDDEIRDVSNRWAPYRSVASWYLWRLTDGDIGAWA